MNENESESPWRFTPTCNQHFMWALVVTFPCSTKTFLFDFNCAQEWCPMLINLSCRCKFSQPASLELQSPLGFLSLGLSCLALILDPGHMLRTRMEGCQNVGLGIRIMPLKFFRSWAWVAIWRLLMLDVQIKCSKNIKDVQRQSHKCANIDSVLALPIACAVVFPVINGNVKTRLRRTNSSWTSALRTFEDYCFF